ncbi:MAG: hypothetical protein JO257_06630 [Deltaproteobacteria bacterium]|nr:hypothetical protein [Deltaproteobacteria bacterium]
MRRLLVGLLVISGCHKDTHSASPKDADALWALTPDGAQLGIVATPRGLAMLEHGWTDVHAFVDKAPDLAPFAKLMDGGLAQLTGMPDFKLADYGLTSEKGGAVFVLGPQQVVIVVPLADRDKFLAKAHGTKGADADTIDKATCKTVQAVYACASNPDLFGKLGKGKLRDKLDARGDIEVVAEGIPGMPMKSAAGVVQLERGAAVVRGTLVGVSPQAIGQLGAPIKPIVDREHAAGFGVVNLGAMLSNPGPDVPLAAGVSSVQLAHSFAGPLTLSVGAGALAFDARIPLTDPAPAQALLDHCTELVPGVTASAGACHYTVPQLPITLDAWLADNVLHIGMQHPPAAAAVALTPFGAELAEGSWSFAFWGRGSMFAAPQLPIPADATKDPQFHLGMRAFAMINELGIGVRAEGDKVHIAGIVRTAWSNPDDVVARLTAFDPAEVFAGKGSAVTTGLPASAPLARDVTAGYAGLMLPVSLVGVVSAVAIPAYLRYLKKSKQPIVEDDLERLEAALKSTWAATGTFPVGDVAPTPAANCMCTPPTHHCTGEPKDWAAGPWQVLQFHPSDPALFAFSYHSDGKTAEVDAVGDLDCDGIAITYRLKVDATSGKPEARIEAPPPNTD